MWTLPLGGDDIKQNQRRQWHSLIILRAIKRPSRAGLATMYFEPRCWATFEEPRDPRLANLLPGGLAPTMSSSDSRHHIFRPTRSCKPARVDHKVPHAHPASLRCRDRPPQKGVIRF